MFNPPFEIVNPPFEIVAPVEVQKPAEEPREDDYVVVFTAKWCNLCQASKVPEELRRKGYRVLIVDVDEEPNEKLKYNVVSLPSYAVIQGRKKVQLGSTLRGVHSTDAIIKYAENFVYTRKNDSHRDRQTLIKHLVRDHGFSESELSNLTASQLDVLHERDHDRKQSKDP